MDDAGQCVTFSRKLRVPEHAKETGNVSKTCRYFGISRETYYCWKRQ